MSYYSVTDNDAGYYTSYSDEYEPTKWSSSRYESRQPLHGGSQELTPGGFARTVPVYGQNSPALADLLKKCQQVEDVMKFLEENVSKLPDDHKLKEKIHPMVLSAAERLDMTYQELDDIDIRTDEDYLTREILFVDDTLYKMENVVKEIRPLLEGGE